MAKIGGEPYAGRRIRSIARLFLKYRCSGDREISRPWMAPALISRRVRE